MTAPGAEGTPVVAVIDAAAEVGVYNSQPEGIGRVVALGSLVCWNNLGRNVVFADTTLRPLAVFGVTAFPDDDEPSQYDLDVHAILDAPERGLVLVLNHLGTVRGFARVDLVGREPGGPVRPAVVTTFLADVERCVHAAGRLVGSRPRVDGAVGLVVSGPFGDALRGPLDVGLTAENFGEVTALGTVGPTAEGLLAVGGERHVAMAALTHGTVGRWRWEREVTFRAAVLVDDGAVLWAAGPEPTDGAVDDYDWDHLGGGGFAAMDREDGRLLAHGRLPSDVAWGTGGVAVAPLAGHLVATGRHGALHLIDPANPAAVRSTAALASSSLGIAHLAAIGERVLYGFNRGGYRLYTFASSAPPQGSTP